jgi:hypothetical protein
MYICISQKSSVSGQSNTVQIYNVNNTNPVISSLGLSSSPYLLLAPSELTQWTSGSLHLHPFYSLPLNTLSLHFSTALAVHRIQQITVEQKQRQSEGKDQVITRMGRGQLLVKKGGWYNKLWEKKNINIIKIVNILLLIY